MRVSALLLLTVLTGCTLNTDYFGDYRGVNLLGNYNFGALDGTTPKWESTTLGLNTIATDNLYMSWEPSADGLGFDLGPDGTSPAYRLEIKNLVSNGDFETGTDQTLSAAMPGTLSSVGWSASGTTQYALLTAHSSTGLTSPTAFGSPTTIDNRSFLFAAQNAGDQVYLSLNTAMTDGSDRWKNGQYRLRLDLLNAALSSDVGVRLFTGSGGALTDPLVTHSNGEWSATVANFTEGSVSEWFSIEDETTDTRRLTLGASSGTASDGALVDNLRVVPEDLNLAARATFPSLKSGKLTLLSGEKTGNYVFTLRVHDDPTADQSDVANHVANRLQPSGITVIIIGTKEDSSTGFMIKQFVERPPGGWTGATWGTISLKGGFAFAREDSELDGNPALELLIIPTNTIDDSTGGRDAGSVLVSQPTLTFNP